MRPLHYHDSSAEAIARKDWHPAAAGPARGMKGFGGGQKIELAPAGRFCGRCALHTRGRRSLASTIFRAQA